MAVADILKDVGKGLATGAKAVGTAALPVLERTAQVVSGEAPQLDEEKRQQAQKREDAEIAARAQVLENNLAIGQKYGTLTPAQQQQYVDQISSLYSHPRHAATLMEKLRKAIHPNGAVALAPQADLPNPVPEGGTAAEDARLVGQKRGIHPVPGVKPFKGPDGLYYQPMYDAQGKIVNEQIEGYTPPPVKSGGKSPPLAGNMLPADAVGANGEPIPEGERSAGKSFVEFGGAWWPVAPAKPILRQVGGDLLLLDAQGKVVRKLASANAKVTRHQTLQPGDDGQMHLVTLTSVTTPEGTKIDVEPEEGGAQGGAEPPKGSAKPSPAPTTPAKKVNPGTILPKTGAKPSTIVGQQAGPVVPGLSTLAHSKSPVFKADVANYNKVNQDATNKMEAYEFAKRAIAEGSTPSSDQHLIYAWVRSNVQGAGRMTQAEFKQAASIGSLDQRAQNWYNLTLKGTLSPEIERMLFADIKRSADISTKEAEDLKKQLESPDMPFAPSGGVENWVRDLNTGKLVKQ